MKFFIDTTDAPKAAASASSPSVTGAPPNARNASTTRCRASVRLFGTAPANRYTRRTEAGSPSPGVRVANRSIAGNGVKV